MTDDTIGQNCPHCRAAYKIGPAHFGRRVRCAQCGQEFRAASAPAASTTPVPSEPPPFRFPEIRQSHAPLSVRRTRAKNVNLVVVLGAIIALGLGLIAAAIVVTSEKTNLPDGSNPAVSMIAVPILIGLVALLYFLPSFIAYSRDHSNILPIAIINIFFGWTLVGWVGSLAWALSSSTNNQRVYVKKVIVRGESDEEEEW